MVFALRLLYCCLYLLTLSIYLFFFSFFFFNDTATTEIYTLSLHDALPITFRTRSPPATRCPGTRETAPPRLPARLESRCRLRPAPRRCPGSSRRSAGPARSRPTDGRSRSRRRRNAVRRRRRRREVR